MTGRQFPLIAGALALLLCGRPLVAQQHADPFAGHVYEPGIDVLDYDFTIDLPDTGATIRGDALVTLRRAAGVTTLRLNLVRSLTVRQVQVDGRDVDAVRTDVAFDVPLTSAVGDSLQVRVRYDGTVYDGLIARQDAQGRWTWFGDNWPDRARQWLPTVDHPSDKATVSWTVRAPSARVVVANGVPLGTRALAGGDAGRSETRWRESHPVPTYVMVIGAGPLVQVPIPGAECATRADSACVRQSVYVLPENRDWMPGPFAAAPRIVALFERLVGPFPYEKLAHLQSETRFGGMENASAIFYASNLFPTHRMSEGLIAHETAHQWFGDAVTEREWGHLWLSEGFATYFATLWTRASRGDSAWHAELSGIRRQVLADSVVQVRPVLDTAETSYLNLLNANSYQKGGYVLAMLHRMLGDSAFFGGLRAYYAEHRDGNALTDDLRRALEKSSGRPLGQFFDQWLRRPGVATPTIGWAYHASTGSVSLLVLQDSARAYALPLTVALTDSLGASRRLEVQVPAARRAELVLPGRFAARPVSIVFDPDDFLLARISRP
ncbi:MAG TPA: M1 family metallopeptidase [Gemmatimonadaceae bacterium]|nr:M1 family metallopeptidase [Gemmatimonadaceae bacterium]